MKILLVSEGKNELSPDDERSPLETLVRRILGVSDLEIVRRRVSDPRVKTEAKRSSGRSLAYEKRARMWIHAAQREGFDAIVLVVDHDGEDERIEGIGAAQEWNASVLPRALGVAVRAFDSWMLADNVALSKAAGVTVPKQRNPEAQHYPKRVCTSLRDQHFGTLSITEMYLAVCENMDISQTADVCPGFATWIDRMKKLRGTFAT